MDLPISWELRLDHSPRIFSLQWVENETAPTVQAAGLPKDALIEIELIAVL